MRTPHIPRLFHNRDYLLLWGGEAVSATGTSVTDIALPLLTLALTHSAAAAGLVVALRALPALLLTLPAGVAVDRWERRRTMLLCDGGRALALASVPLAAAFERLSLAQLCLVSAIEGSLAVVFGLAEAACLPRVVPAELLPDAMAQSELTEGAVTLIGPTLGGLLFTARRTLPFLADALSYVASLIGLAALRVRLQEERAVQPRHLLGELRDAAGFVWRQPLLRAMTWLNGGAGLFAPGRALIVIVLAQRQHASAAAIGLIFAAEGLGTIAGAPLGVWSGRRMRVGRAVLLARGVTTMLWLLMAFAPNPAALAAIGFGAGLIDPVEDVPYFSYRHRLIPDAVRGRVIAVCRLAPSLTRPIGLALVGVLLQQIGPGRTVIVSWLWLTALTVALALVPAVWNAPALASAAS